MSSFVGAKLQDLLETKPTTSEMSKELRRLVENACSSNSSEDLINEPMTTKKEVEGKTECGEEGRRMQDEDENTKPHNQSNATNTLLTLDESTKEAVENETATETGENEVTRENGTTEGNMVIRTTCTSDTGSISVSIQVDQAEIGDTEQAHHKNAIARDEEISGFDFSKSSQVAHLEDVDSEEADKIDVYGGDVISGFENVGSDDLPETASAKKEDDDDAVGPPSTQL